MQLSLLRYQARGKVPDVAIPSWNRRVKWFQTGYAQGSLQACDTFAPATVE